MTIRKEIDFKKIHNHCIACSDANNLSMNLKFVTDNCGKTYAQFRAEDRFQGYNGILHGGIITTLLDATMTHCLFAHGIVAYTGDIHVRFLHPIPYNSLANLQAEIKAAAKRLYILKSEIILQQKVMAWAEAKFCQAEFSNQTKN